MYAVLDGENTVIFSKRRKNSSLCAPHTAPCFEPNVDRSFISKLFWVSSDWERCGTLRDGVNVL